MVNRIGLAALLLALAAPSWANTALQEARVMAGGNALGAYDGGCTGPSCGARVEPCQGAACRINATSSNALRTNNLVVAPRADRARAVPAVPAPELGADAEGAKDKPGFLKSLFSGKGLMYGLGGAAAGAGIGWMVAGPIGAVVGGLIGAIGGFFLSKLLSK